MVCTERIWAPEEDLKSCMYRKAQGTPSKVGQSCQIFRVQLSWSWIWARIVGMVDKPTKFAPEKWVSRENLIN